MVVSVELITILIRRRLRGQSYPMSIIVPIRAVLCNNILVAAVLT